MALIPSRRIVWQVVTGVIDGPDPDDEPDIIPAEGEVEFEASVSYIPLPGAVPNPVTVLTTKFKGIFDEQGYLCVPVKDAPKEAGKRGIRSFVNDDPSLSVKGWTLSVKPKFKVVNGSTPDIKPFSIAVVHSEEDLDLTKQVHVPSSPGVGVGQAMALLGLAQEASTSSAQSAEEAAAVALQVKADADAGLFKGAKGDPGPNTVPTQQAVADAITTPGSAAAVALSGTIAPAITSRAGRNLVVMEPGNFAAGTMIPTTWQTPDGSGVVVHPSVQFFPQGFNGYRWWAAMTPYAGSDNQKENPCIMVSADGTNWTQPPGVVNPLYPPQNGGYNSDTHLIQGPDGKLYLFFRDFSSTGTHTEKIMLMDSADGITWSAPRMVVGNVSNVQRLMSPAVWHDGRQWVMVAVEIIANPRVIVRYTANAPYGPWVQDAAPVILSPSWPSGRAPWHIDAQLIGGQVVMLVQDSVNASGSGNVYLLTSGDNGKTFNRPANPLATGNYYRSCLLPVTTEGGLGFDVWLGHGAPWGVTRTLATVRPALAPEPLTAGQRYALDYYSIEKRLPPYLLGDFFDRANGAGLGVAISGQAWTPGIGSLSISGGRVCAAADLNSRETIDAGRADYRLTIDLYTQKVAGHQIWIVLRYIDARNYLRVGINGAGWQLQRVSNNVGTTLKGTNLLTNADGKYSVTIHAKGDKITATVPEAQLPFGEVSETLGQTSSLIGLQMDHMGLYADNLIIQTVP